MDRDKILDKIKKCMALSQSPEPAEAAAALRQAQKLMQLHGIGTSDLRRAEIGSTTVRSKASVSRPKSWELALISTVSKAFGCRVLWTNSSSYAHNVYGHYTLIGLVDQVKLAEYACSVLGRKLVNGRVRYVSTLPSFFDRKRKTFEADGFCHGWVKEIAKLVIEFAHSDEDKKAIDDRVNELSGGETKVKNRKIGAAGYAAGMEAARGETLHRPVNGSTDTRSVLGHVTAATQLEHQRGA
jgi:hypothetical protein